MAAQTLVRCIGTYYRLINALRVAALCIIVKYDYELLNFNHDYTFYARLYGWVFLTG